MTGRQRCLRLIRALSAPLVLGAWLGGCANLSPPADNAPAQPTTFWQGRFVVVIDTEPKQSQRASFELQGSAQRGQLDILSPIGTTIARAQWQPNKASLIKGGQYTDYANLRALSSELGQTDLPVEALFDWLEGRADTAPSPALADSAWRVDLCQAAQGRLKAWRAQPAPALSLTIVFTPPAKGAIVPTSTARCAP